MLALGKIGDKASHVPTLATLQRTAPPSTCSRPIAAAICLLGGNCASHVRLSERDAARSPSTSRRSRRCCAGRVPAWAPCSRVAGSQEACDALFDAGHRRRRRPGPRADRARRLALVALRQPRWSCWRRSRTRADPGAALALLPRGVRHARGGFRGGAVLRRRAAGLLGGARGICAEAPGWLQALIEKLEF